MLNPEDRDAIDGLFERIDTVARASGPRDEEAEALIRQRLRDAPASPYYMAQTILMQEHALRVAEQRINELEAQGSRRPSGGILGGLFGGEEPQRGQQPAARRAPRGPWGESRDYEDERPNRRGGGGFLAGAAQTALGVTGGVLLGSAIAGMLTGGAHAQEMPADQPVDEPAEDFDSGMDDGGDFDIGGDF